MVQRISDEVLAAMRQPDVAKKFTDLGLDISPLGPPEFKQFLAAEYDKWGAIIRDTRIRLEE